MTTEEIYRALADRDVTPEQAAAGVRDAQRRSARPVHVVDQSDQPFGSFRRCCNMCGAMTVDGMRYVASMATWRDLPADGRCRP